MKYKLFILLLMFTLLLYNVNAILTDDIVFCIEKGSVWDATGNGYDATNSGADNVTGFDGSNKAFDFTASEADYLGLTNDVAFQNQDFSIYTVMKKETTQVASGILDYERYPSAVDVADHGYSLISDDADCVGCLYLRIGDGAGGGEKVGKTAAGLDNGWIIVVSTFDSSDKRGVIYINDTVRGNSTLTGGNALFDQSADLGLGNTVEGNYASSNPFDGIIDRVCLWSRTLTPSEASELYNSASPLYYADMGVSAPPVISNINCTSCNPSDSNFTVDTTPTFSLDTDINSNCKVSNFNGSYAECSTTNTTSHICTINTSQAYNPPEQNYTYFNCSDISDSTLWSTSRINITIHIVPVPSDNTTSGTVNATSVEFRTKWTDDIFTGLSSYVFSFHNATNTTTCTGTPSTCDTHTDENVCDTSGCTWTNTSSVDYFQIRFDDIENGTSDVNGWQRSTGSNPDTLDCNYLGDFDGCDNNGGDYQAGADSGLVYNGTYSLLMEDWDTWDSTKGLWWTFNPTTACGGSACDYIMLIYYWRQDGLDSGEYMIVEGTDDAGTQTLEQCFGTAPDECPTSFTRIEHNLSNSLDDTDTSWTIRIGSEMGGTNDEAIWDDFLIRGYKSAAGGGVCSGTPDPCSTFNLNQNNCTYFTCDYNNIELFVNDTAVSFTGTYNWSNTTKTISDNVGDVIKWQYLANDTKGEYNLTDIFQFTVTAAGPPGNDTCDCSSIQAGTTIDCSESCTITTCDASGQDITIDGEGSITITGDITNHGDVFLYGDGPSNRCIITCNGGCFQTT